MDAVFLHKSSDIRPAIDQVEFIENLLQPSKLLRQMKLYVDDEISANLYHFDQCLYAHRLVRMRTGPIQSLGTIFPVFQTAL